MIDTKTQINRIDTYEYDERFYQRKGERSIEYVPSVTYILGVVYPSDYGLTYWRGDVGNRRADEILEETATDGSFVHHSIENMINGKKVSSKDIQAEFNPKRSLKIKKCLKSFLDWVDEFKPEFLNSEYIVWNDKERYAGTVDCYCKIGDQFYFIDFKTSKSIHTTHKVQITAYASADGRDGIPAILHLGNTTKKNYSFLELKPEDVAKYLSQFYSANHLFQTLYPNAKPTEEVFPEYFKLNQSYDKIKPNLET